MAGRCRGAAAARGPDGTAMSGVSRHSPARGGRASRLPLRLILGVAMLYGCGHAASEEPTAGLVAIDVAERADGMTMAVDGRVEIVVEDCDVKADGNCGDSAQPVTDVVEAAKPVDEGAGEVVDEAARVVADVGECSGRRFKKCR